MLEFLLPECAATKAGLTPARASLSIVARIIIILVVGVLLLDFLFPESPPLRLRERSLFLGSQSFPLSEGGGESTSHDVLRFRRQRGCGLLRSLS